MWNCGDGGRQHRNSLVPAIVASASLVAAASPAHIQWARTPWTAIHQWTPLSANITLVRRPSDDVRNVSARWRILHLTDAHISLSEARDLHETGTRRMHSAFRVNGDRHLDRGAKRAPADTFKRLLELASHYTADAVVLTGDIVNFPHNETVQHVLNSLMASCRTPSGSRIPWVYTSGNHDWLVEGLARGRKEQRAFFRHKVLRPLYRGVRGSRPSLCGQEGEDCGMLELGHGSAGGRQNGKDESKLLILTLDTSMHEISSSQADFVWKQLSRGLPTILAVHVPLMLPGATPKDNKHVLCGDPRYGYGSDTSWHIERRERWPRSGSSPSTLRFVEDVVRRFAAPRGPLLGILGGHEHVHRADKVGRTLTPPLLNLRCHNTGHDQAPRCESESSSNAHVPGVPLLEGLVQYVTPPSCEGGHRLVEVRDSRFA